MSAQDWAWKQVCSPNLRFEPEIALVLLAAAKLADDALDHPNGYRYTTDTEIETLTKLDSVMFNRIDLVACGLLVRYNGASSIAVRVPEEAFA